MSKLSDWLKEWDAGNFDFTSETAGNLHPEMVQKKKSGRWKPQPEEQLEAQEIRAFSKVYPIAAALLCTVMIIFLFLVVREMPPFGSADTPANSGVVMERYVTDGLRETGAVNIVAGVILDYRAFDTLGESHVLFTATIAVFILLLLGEDEKETEWERLILQDDLVLHYTARFLVPFIMLFGMYVILNGHLGPGGGFSGGAIIGSGMILYSLSYGPKNLRRVVNMKSFRGIVLCALLFYSFAKCYSFFCGANGLHTIFTTGTPGAILSAGLILPLNIAVGLVVACTMYGLYAIFSRGRI